MQKVPGQAEPQHLPIGKASKLLGVSIHTIRRWETAGKINLVRTPGGTRLVPYSEIERLLASEKGGVAMQLPGQPQVTQIQNIPSKVDQIETYPIESEGQFSRRFFSPLQFVVIIMLLLLIGIPVLIFVVFPKGITKNLEGASKTLSNLTKVALNTSLIPSSNNSIDLGSSSSQFRTAYIGTSIVNTGSSGSTTLVFDKPESNQTIHIPNQSGTLCTTGSVCSGYQPSGTYVIGIVGTANRITATLGTTSRIDISSSYAGQGSISIVGGLSSGSITNGFGAISTGNSITGSVLVSTVGNGTSPLLITSNTLVSNLNADRWDSQDLPALTGNNGKYLKASGASLVWDTPVGGGGATPALDNLAAVAINTSLLPSLANNNLIDLGDGTHQFRTSYIGTSLVFGTNGGNSTTLNFTAPSATNVITLPDKSGTVALTSNKLSDFASTTSAELAGAISDETGSGALVFATSPVFTTPNIGSATGSISGNAGTATALAADPTDCGANTWATAIAASGNLTCAAVTYAGITSMTSANLASIISDETGTDKVVFSNSPAFVDDITIGTTGTATGSIIMNGTTSGTVIIKTADAAGTYTLTLPTDDGTPNQYLQTDGLGVLSWATASGGMVYPGAGIANSTGAAWGTSYSTTGSGTVVALATSPSFTTPSLGTATATSINKVAITAPASGATLTIADGKTLSASDSTTLATSSITLGNGKVLTLSDSTTLATNSITFGGTETLTLAATKNVAFADAFSTSGAFPITLTATASTSVTLPTSGTLCSTASVCSGYEPLLWQRNTTILSPYNPGDAISTTGHLAIGATASISADEILSVKETFSTGTPIGIRVNPTLNTDLSNAFGIQVDPIKSDANATSGLFGLKVLPTVSGTGLIPTELIGIQTSYSLGGTTTGSGGLGYGIKVVSPTGSVGTAISTAYGIYIQNYGKTNIGTASYGLYVADQTTAGGPSEYGIAIAGADTYALWLGSGADNTDAANGITFGQTAATSANLYRSADNTLKTDDSFISAGLASVSGANSVSNVPYNFLVDKDTTNLVVNPSFEVNKTDGWQPYGALVAGDLSQEAAPYVGSYSLRIYKTGAAIGDGAQTTTMAVAASTKYVASVFVKGVSGSPTFKISLTGNNSGQTSSAVAYTASAARWTRFFIYKANTIDDTFTFEIYSSAAQNFYIYVDAVQLEVASCDRQNCGTTYADGSLGPGYSWRGTAHNSISDRTAGIKYLGGGANVPDFYAETVYFEGGNGDLNLSGNFSATDSGMMNNYLAGTYNFEPTQLALADISGDGKVSLDDQYMLNNLVAGTTTTKFEMKRAIGNLYGAYSATTFTVNGTASISNNLAAGTGVATGTTTLDIYGTGTAYAVCHSSQTGVDDQGIVDCTGAPIADYAEQYPVEQGVEYGDLVTTSQTTVTTKDGDNLSRLTKTNMPYEGNIIGIVSDNYGDFTSAGYNIAAEDNPMPIALSGRVLTKVSTENGDIQPGDPLTSSSISGAAMKATQSGPIVGKALEGYGSEGIGKIMVFVSVGWYVEPLGDGNSQLGSLNNLTDLSVLNLVASNINTELIMVGNNKLSVAADGSLSIEGDTKITGDLNVLGSITAKDVTAGKINIATGSAEPNGKSNDSTGSATILSGKLEVTIETTAITSKSRVFVTATSPTGGQALVVAQKRAGEGFTVNLDHPVGTDINFDWFIIN